MEKLTHLSLIKIEGDDALDFLQGQLTNDIHRCDNRWQFSGYCTPKGRLLALFQVWRLNDTVYALVENSVVSSSLKRLRMYVLRSKVSIEEIANAKCFGVFSHRDYPELSAMSGHQARMLNERMMALSYGNRFLLIDLADSLSGEPGTRWLAADIEQGLPRVCQASQELFIPQMLNLDILDGISFKKGCYTGQEIVARMHYLGNLKQRMFLCELTDDGLKPNEDQVQNAEKVYLNDDASKVVGSIVSAVAGSDYVLAVLRLDQLQRGPFRLATGVTITVHPEQPYALPE